MSPEELSKATDCSVDQVNALIEEWKKFDANKRPLSKKEFSTLLTAVHDKFPHPGLNTESFRESVADLFDANHDNKLEFNEVISGLAVFSSGDPKKKAALVFDSIDKNGDGNLTHNELKTALSQSLENGKHIYTKKFLADMKGEPAVVAFIMKMGVSGVTSLFRKALLKSLPGMEKKIFEVAKSSPEHITRDEWISNAESNEAIKHFLGFKLGEYVKENSIDDACPIPRNIIESTPGITVQKDGENINCQVQ
jgi:Ca2+-binding EF-hand superfamily protein